MSNIEQTLSIIKPDAVERNLENEIKTIFYKNGFKIVKEKIDTVIFDLGLSSIQLNDLKRGFSFKSKDQLDMSMGLSHISAQEVINNLSEQNLKLIIKELGEEKEASIISKNIVKARAENKITRVDQLVNIIEKSKKKIIIVK